MTTRTFTGKGGETWTWEETKESVEALKKYWDLVNKNNSNK